MCTADGLPGVLGESAFLLGLSLRVHVYLQRKQETSMNVCSCISISWLEMSCWIQLSECCPPRFPIATLRTISSTYGSDCLLVGPVLSPYWYVYLPNGSKTLVNYLCFPVPASLYLVLNPTWSLSRFYSTNGVKVSHLVLGWSDRDSVHVRNSLSGRRDWA